MRSRLIKLACATALAVPLVGAVSAGSAHAWDCDRPYGAVTSHPTCNEPGISFRNHHRHHHHDYYGGGYGPWGGGGAVELR
jgi:hypothetical protein